MTTGETGRDPRHSRAMEQYRDWVGFGAMDPELLSELRRMSEAEIFECFYRDLEFGTGGLRGIIGAGTDRMNIYTVGRATQGFADFINSHAQAPAVAIAYDSRIGSDLFARRAAGVFAANGIRVHIFRELMPTPALSFAVRHLKADGGVVVTASHNPAKYNGYKAYNSEGCQLPPAEADDVIACIGKIDLFRDVRHMDFEEGLASGMIRYIGEDVVQAYLDAVQAESMCAPTGCRLPEGHGNGALHVVYTPLNGTGSRCVRAILDRIGIGRVTTVPEQDHPDGNFPTCPYPNPEKKEALALGLALCRKLAAEARLAIDVPDLLLATDPDADRVGIAVRHGGDYVLLSGNEVGVLLLDYICRMRSGSCGGAASGVRMPEDPLLVKTIVSTRMADAVATAYGVGVADVLTGFKFIGELIGRLEREGGAGRYIFGFEESYGYLAGSYVRDKDAVNASMLICEMAALEKAEGRTLVDAMQALYSRFGHYKNDLLDFAFEGAEGMDRMAAVMRSFRDAPPIAAAGRMVLESADYLTSVRTRLDDKGTVKETIKIDLPESDVLEYVLEDGSSLIVRPSGTEPKLKVYLSAKGATESDSNQTVQRLASEMSARVKTFQVGG